MRSVSKSHFLFTFFFLSFLIIPVYSCHALEVTEQKIKVITLYKIIRFIKWPEASYSKQANTITVGLISSNDDVAKTFKLIENRAVGKRKILVKKVDSAEQIANCQILYISHSDAQRIHEILKIVKDSPVLTIGDRKDFTRTGGIMRFYFKSQKIRFEINITAAQRASLRISSKLLELASVIE